MHIHIYTHTHTHTQPHTVKLCLNIFILNSALDNPLYLSSILIKTSSNTKVSKNKDIWKMKCHLRVQLKTLRYIPWLRQISLNSFWDRYSTLSGLITYQHSAMVVPSKIFHINYGFHGNFPNYKNACSKSSLWFLGFCMVIYYHQIGRASCRERV